ncbi:hypothetical protein P12x_005942 (plasmid) [Tundrisphaera lichenicola]|uniref:hypothetical protein n=1 Tax=Tundrisphaera lichenicola TaxID=2029860 RepID=UPI003EC0E018
MSFKYLAVLVLGMSAPAAAQDSYKIELLKEAPPAGLAAGVKETLETQGYRVLDPEGKPYVELWLRKGTPASAKPSGPKGAILYPVLAEGELIGALKYVVEGYDYRDQAIVPGVYTIRYGLQPVNGDHLGVSVNRDYALLLPASKDTDPADLAEKKLEKQSAEAAGTTHPAVLLLLAPPKESPEGPSMANDLTLNTWGAILSLPLEVKGETGPVPLPVQLVVVGAKTD